MMLAMLLAAADPQIVNGWSIDRGAERSIGRCAYHVTHPGGRSYEQRPVNAREAESRRHARFFVWGHATDVDVPPSAVLDRELPFTLDLRPPPR